MALYSERGVSGRQAIIHLGNLLADALHPTTLQRHHVSGERARNREVGDDFGYQSFEDTRPDYTAHERALKQIDGIVQALGQGKDLKAKKYLQELIDEQSRSENREYLTKSLCNIAQKCSYMFRADFERQCLYCAIEVAPNDAWTLIQMGNHLKRVGQFDEAVNKLESAARVGDPIIAQASIADVWREKGEYDRAKAAYEHIPNWQSVMTVRTGLADIMRFRGELDEAMAEYDRILTEWPEADRAEAGRAEILRYKGRFDDSIAIYDSLIYSVSVESFAKLVYKSAKCTALKQANRLDEAFDLADEIVRTTPFDMAARIHRASISELLGKEKRGLASLPRNKVPQAFDTWIKEYYDGLYLLKVERYKTARKILVDRLNSALITPDSRAALRLGAAFAFLCENEIEPATTMLLQVRDARDYYTEYVCNVLELHLAVVNQNQQLAAEIASRLENAKKSDVAVAREIANALHRGDFFTARQHELLLLLRLAA